MKVFYRVYEFSHICTKENLPNDWETNRTIVVQQTIPSGDDIVTLLENDIESANYHSWANIPRRLYNVLLGVVTNEQAVDEIMRQIYENDVFEV